MINLTSAIYDRLLSEAGLASRLSLFDGQPAIFTAIPVPDAAELPYIVIYPSTSDVPDSTIDDTGELRDIRRDIALFSEATGSVAWIEETAELLRAAIHHRAADLGVAIAQVTNGPIQAPTDDSVYGRLITCRFGIGV